eukprot:4431336-Alexandrium_andersonii.AAC.1
MSASLVGSEMCIRDSARHRGVRRVAPLHHSLPAAPLWLQQFCLHGAGFGTPGLRCKVPCAQVARSSS